MKVFIRYTLAAALLILLLQPASQAQNGKAQQQLIMRVNELSAIDLSVPSLNLIINQAPIEGDFITASNSDGFLLWTTNGENRKITVASDQPSPRYTLKVLAENISNKGGVAGPEVTLNDDKNHDLILGVSRTAGRCVLRLTAISTLEEGIGSESRLLTYTIMNN